MNFAADMGRHSGRATPSLHDGPYRQFDEPTGRRSTYPAPIPVQTNRATSLLDGMELEEMRLETGVEVEHILIADAHYTWWECGRSYLCRMIDMLHMGYVDEILFGTEIKDRLPAMVTEWVEKTRARQAEAEVVLPDETPLL